MQNPNNSTKHVIYFFHDTFLLDYIEKLLVIHQYTFLYYNKVDSILSAKLHFPQSLANESRQQCPK